MIYFEFIKLLANAPAWGRETDRQNETETERVQNKKGSGDGRVA